MIKTIKDFRTAIKEGIREGIQEGRQELQIEAASNAAESGESTLGENLQAISTDEQFAVALAAPYREVYSRCVGSWAGKSAITLYQVELPANDLKHYAKILKRDFDIVDEASALAAIAEYKKELEQGTEYAKVYHYLLKRHLLKSTLKQVMAEADINHPKKAVDAVLSNQALHEVGSNGGDAFRIAVIAHIASAAGALGYLHKYQVMLQLHFVSHRAKKHYSSWQQYSDGFIAGRHAWGLQGLGAEKVLTNAIKKLHSKEQSPWRTIAWG